MRGRRHLAEAGSCQALLEGGAIHDVILRLILTGVPCSTMACWRGCRLLLSFPLGARGHTLHIEACLETCGAWETTEQIWTSDSLDPGMPSVGLCTLGTAVGLPSRCWPACKQGQQRLLVRDLPCVTGLDLTSGPSWHGRGQLATGVLWLAISRPHMQMEPTAVLLAHTQKDVDNQHAILGTTQPRAWMLQSWP